MRTQLFPRFLCLAEIYRFQRGSLPDQEVWAGSLCNVQYRQLDEDKELKLVATTISRQQEDWQLSEIPYHCETVPMNAPVFDPFAYTLGLARKRNLAVTTVLEKYPDAS